MFITSQEEIYSIIPTAKWSQPERLYGWIQEEEEACLIPLLGEDLYSQLLNDYKRLVGTYGEITAMSIRPDGTLINKNANGYVTERTDDLGYEEDDSSDDSSDDQTVVGSDDMARIGLIRLCQQIEMYEMLGHKTGLLAVSFNEGGVNRVGASNYDTAEDKDVERASKEAFLSAKRSTDALLMTLERDARGERRFTSLWKKADYYYLRSDLLFTTAHTMKDYYNLGGSREKYISLVKDIRFCQNMYIAPKLGTAFLSRLVKASLGEETGEDENTEGIDGNVLKETLNFLRQALGLFVEARQNAKTRNAMSDTMADAKQALATAVEYIQSNQSAFGSAIEDSPLYHPTVEEAETPAKPKHQEPVYTEPKEPRKRAIFTFPRGGTVEPW